jgi:hypothetical protein
MPGRDRGAVPPWITPWVCEQQGGAEQDRNQDVGEAACGGASSTEELSEINYSAASALSKGSAVTESIDADPDQALIHFEQSDSTFEDETTREKQRCGRNCGES